MDRPSRGIAHWQVKLNGQKGALLASLFHVNADGQFDVQNLTFFGSLLYPGRDTCRSKWQVQNTGTPKRIDHDRIFLRLLQSLDLSGLSPDPAYGRRNRRDGALAPDSGDRDISDDVVLRDLCEQCALDPAAFLAGIADPGIKAQLKANTEELVRRGGFGSPTMFIGDDMYFGNDRLALVRAAALRQKAAQ